MSGEADAGCGLQCRMPGVRAPHPPSRNRATAPFPVRRLRRGAALGECGGQLRYRRSALRHTAALGRAAAASVGRVAVSRGCGLWPHLSHLQTLRRSGRLLQQPPRASGRSSHRENASGRSPQTLPATRRRSRGLRLRSGRLAKRGHRSRADRSALVVDSVFPRSTCW